MEKLLSKNFTKIVNPELGLASLHGLKPYGRFKVFIRLAHADKRPNDLQIGRIDDAGFCEAVIPCSRMESIAADDNVLSIELREHIA